MNLFTFFFRFKKHIASVTCLLALLFISNAVFALPPVLQKLFLIGTVAPITTLKVQAEVSGKIREIYVTENENVRKGELLLSLDNELQQQQLDIAQIQWKLRKNAIKETKIRLKDAQQRYDEERTLQKQGASSKSLLTQIQLKLQQAQLATERAKLNGTLAGKEVEVRKIAYEKTLIHSSIEGVVTRKYVESGEFVGMNVLLFEVVNLHRVRIESSVSESEVALIREGQSLRFTTTAYPNISFSGTVERVSWSSNPQNRRFSIYILAKNADFQLRSGMTANIELSLLQMPQ